MASHNGGQFRGPCVRKTYPPGGEPVVRKARLECCAGMTHRGGDRDHQMIGAHRARWQPNPAQCSIHLANDGQGGGEPGRDLGHGQEMMVRRRSRRGHRGSERFQPRRVSWLYRYLGGANAKVLPVPMMNILNGGKHADNNVDFQEFMIVPVDAVNFAEALRMGTETFHSLKGVLKKKGYNTAVGDEGGFAPNLKSNEEAIEVILDAIVKAGMKPGKDIFLALDPAASEFFEKGKYVFRKSDKSAKKPEQMVKFYEKWVKEYPIISIEDGMAENDWEGWTIMTETK